MIMVRYPSDVVGNDIKHKHYKCGYFLTRHPLTSIFIKFKILF